MVKIIIIIKADLVFGIDYFHSTISNFTLLVFKAKCFTFTDHM